jgi:hypothetical protein
MHRKRNVTSKAKLPLLVCLNASSGIFKDMITPKKAAHIWKKIVRADEYTSIRLNRP